MIVVTATKFEEAQRVLFALPRAAEKAMARALTRAAVAGRQAAVFSIGERYAVRVAEVRSKIELSTATPEELAVTVTARSSSISLTAFPHTPTRAGTGGRGQAPLRAEVLRGESREVPGAFIATINGRPRVMIRTGATTSTGRSAMRSVYSVPIAFMLNAESVREAVELRALDVIDERLAHEIDRALQGAA